MPKGRGDALRAAVLALGRKRRNDRVPAGLRERLVRHAQARRRAGWGWGAIARELGVAGSTLQRWCAPDRGSMRRVRVTRARRPAGTMPGRVFAVVTASGHRVEGLRVEEAASLLRALAG